MPYFSVLIPSYNRPEFLINAVNSVLGSRCQDLEVLISDDKSPRQEEILSRLEPFREDPRVTIFPQKENLGEARNRHFLMQKASGIFSIIIGDDDLLSAEALGTLKDVILRRPSFDFYLFGYSVIDELNNIYETRRGLTEFELRLENGEVTRDLLCSDFHPFWLYHPATFCFRSSLHNAIAPNHSIGIGDDYLFLYDAILGGKRALVVPKVLFSYRRFMFQGKSGHRNLSQGRLANVITRRHMLYALLAKTDIPAVFSSFIREFEFRRRFLYDAIVTDPDASEQAIADLELESIHLEEALSYLRTHRRRWFRHWLLTKRVAAYTRYFGLSGLGELGRVFFQQRAYRRMLKAN